MSRAGHHGGCPHRSPPPRPAVPAPIRPCWRFAPGGRPTQRGSRALPGRRVHATRPPRRPSRSSRDQPRALRAVHARRAVRAAGAGERIGAATWRAFARAATRQDRRDVFLACALLEERSAEFLDPFLEQPDGSPRPAAAERTRSSASKMGSTNPSRWTATVGVDSAQANKPSPSGPSRLTLGASDLTCGGVRRAAVMPPCDGAEVQVPLSERTVCRARRPATHACREPATGALESVVVSAVASLDAVLGLSPSFDTRAARLWPTSATSCGRRTGSLASIRITKSRSGSGIVGGSGGGGSCRC